MLIVGNCIWLKPDYTESAEQPKAGPDLEFPLANDKAFFRKKCQRQERCEDYRRSSENRVDARAYVEKSHHLRDLMNNVWQARQKTKPNCSHVDGLAEAVGTPEHQRRDRDAGHGIAIEILRPRIIKPIQVIHEKGRQRPDKHSTEDRGITF